MKYEFRMVGSIVDLVEYPDAGEEVCQPSTDFQAVMDALKIKVPIGRINARFFDSPLHSGDVLVYGAKDTKACIVLDTYRDPLDQMDMIRFGWRCSDKDKPLLQRLSRQLYDNLEYGVHYEEGHSPISAMLREDQFPKKYYYVTVFEQQVKYYTE